MNKSVIAGAVIIALGGGAFAGMSIADGKIKEFYNQSSIGFAKNIKTTQNLGMMGGTVEWTADLALDPCRPDDVLTFKGTDTVRKGLGGYSIHSKFRPILTDETLKAEFDKVPDMEANTSFDWSGGGKSTIFLPAHEMNKDDTSLAWEKISFNTKFSLKDGEFVADNAQADAPSISFKDKNASVTIKNINYDTNVPMLGKTLRNGQGSFKVQSFNLEDPKTSVIAENFIVKVQQTVNRDKADTSVEYSLGTLKIKDEENRTVTMQDAKVNIKFADVHREALEKIVQLLDKSSKECIAQSDIVKQLEPHLVTLANAGLKIESKGNQVKFGDSIATADAEVIAPTHTYTDVRNITEKLPTLVTYQLNMEFDKALIRNLSQMTGKKLSEDELNMAWQQIIAQSGGTVTGDRLKIEKKSTSSSGPVTDNPTKTEQKSP